MTASAVRSSRGRWRKDDHCNFCFEMCKNVLKAKQKSTLAGKSQTPFAPNATMNHASRKEDIVTVKIHTKVTPFKAVVE